MASTGITDRDWGGADPPPPTNIQRAEPEVRLAGGDAVQWGLASLAYSALLLISVPLGLITLILLPMLATITPSWDAGGRVGTTILVILGVLCFDVLALASLVVGAVALRAARAAKQPAALPAIGLLLGVGAVFGWVLTSVASGLVLTGLWHIKM